MRLATCVSAFAIVPLVVVACSDGGGGSSSPKVTYPPDAASPVPAPLPARAPITIVVKGHGHVGDSYGVFDCGESGGLDGGTCKAPYGSTLYAAAYVPWAFDHWEPTMSFNDSVQIEDWTVDPLTAVFVLPAYVQPPITDAGSGGD